MLPLVDDGRALGEREERPWRSAKSEVVAELCTAAIRQVFGVAMSCCSLYLSTSRESVKLYSKVIRLSIPAGTPDRARESSGLGPNTREDNSRALARRASYRWCGGAGLHL